MPANQNRNLLRLFISCSTLAICVLEIIYDGSCYPWTYRVVFAVEKGCFMIANFLIIFEVSKQLQGATPNYNPVYIHIVYVCIYLTNLALCVTNPEYGDCFEKSIWSPALIGLLTFIFFSSYYRRSIKLRKAQLTDENLMCSVCLQNYAINEDVRVFPCEHEYHKGCADPWLLISRTCPLCRIDV